MLLRRLLVAAALLGTAACSPVAVPEDEPRPATRTVEHARGAVEVPRNPQRVVVLGVAELDSAVALGLRPVGAATGEGGTPSYLAAAVPDLAQVGEVGTPDLARVEALEPDLVLGSEDRVGDRYDALAALAPTVLTPTTGADWQADLVTHAAALGRAPQATALLAAYEARVAELGSRVRALAPGRRTVPGPTSTLAEAVLTDLGLTAAPAGAEPALPVPEREEDAWSRGGGAAAADRVLDDLERALAAWRQAD